MEGTHAQTQTQTQKLNDTQLVILSAAAQRSDHALLPFPQNLSVRGAALDKIITSLLKRSLIEERPVADGAREWRRDEDSRAYSLFLTTAGLAALGIDDTEKDQPATAAAPGKGRAETACPRRNVKKASSATPKKRSASPQSKQALVIKMLRRKPGATIDDIVAETDWQPHSVRGFFSGIVKKKLKLPLVSEVGKNGVRRYRIAAATSHKA
ncbi:hypothetical protein AUC70_04280 [Methyloceanibacter stevinii]|uniref:DUF3489 domain-containing protein n=2 Tax=Methyloceanibacter stevinii TaxID=1774970 RepID=A0A1E3VN83_9HYPH|nr:hypothetical protein AUC70_04280 [Methyloceanibacter stevinii]